MYKEGTLHSYDTKHIMRYSATIVLYYSIYKNKLQT